MKRSGMPSVSVGSAMPRGREQFDHRGAGAAGDRVFFDRSRARVCRAASRSTSSSSSGLTKRMLTSVASRRSPMMLGRLDHRAESEDQQGRCDLRGGSRLADRQRGHFGDRRDARTLAARIAHRRGPASVVAVYSICRHSFSSAGAMTTRFGMQRRKE